MDTPNIISTVPVKTKTTSYDVKIGRGLLSSLSKILSDVVCEREEKQPDKVFVITDDNVWKHHKDTVLESFQLESNGNPTDEEIKNSDDWKEQDGRGEQFNSYFNVIVFPAGEKSKNPTVLVKCLDAMAQAGLTRDSVVIALGGGVACDLGGFAAATYMRGIRVLQVPTSLLAMVDASVGGKTAVDLAAGKNLFGAFHQPIGVVIDLDVLCTLSEDQFRDSLGEVVKHSVLADPQLFDFLKVNKLTKESAALDGFADIVKRNVEIKRDIVEGDECEKGARQTLNLGHTVGHAIEAASNYSLGHGSCVAAGMCILTHGCGKAGITPVGVANDILRACEAQGLPTGINVDGQTLIKFIKNDKKRHANSVNLIIVKEIGNCIVQPFTFQEIEKLLN